MMRLEEKRKAFLMPDDYEEAFYKAELTFKYQLVYDVDSDCLVHLNELEQEVKETLIEDWSFLGPMIDSKIASGIAQGNLNPVDWRPFERELPTPSPDITTSTSSLELESAVPNDLLMRTSLDNRISLKRNYATAINNSCKSYAERVKSYQETRKSRVAPPLTEHLQHIPSYLLKAVKPRKSKEVLPTNQTTILHHLRDKNGV